MILSGNIHASSEMVKNLDFLDSIYASLAYALGTEPLMIFERMNFRERD